MRVSVFYFSGTGNTEWAVNQLYECLINEGNECRVYNIENEIIGLNETIKNSDIVGFAFPIYGANMPNIMFRFLQELNHINDGNIIKPAFIVTTAGYVDGFGPLSANRQLKTCGFKLLSYNNIKLSNNLSTPLLKASIQSNDNIKIRIERNKLVISKIVNHIITKKKYIRNIGPYLIPGYIIRKVTKKSQKDCYLALSVNKDQCKKCMLCVNRCPTKSIIFMDGNFRFLSTCTACMRCYNFCPTNAIYHFGKYADPEIYKRYKGPPRCFTGDI